MSFASHSVVAEARSPAGSATPGPAEALVVSELFPPAIGGSGQLLQNVYSDFDGVPVTVLTDDGAGAGSAATDANMHVIREPMRTTYWGLARPRGLRHHVRHSARLRRLCSGKRVVVHCGRALPEGLSAWIARRMRGGPYLCWAHGEEIAYAKSSRELRVLMRRVYKDSSAVIANSRNTSRVLEEFGVPTAQIEVVHPGVDAQRFRPDVKGATDLRRELTARDELLFLTVGRLERRKGHDLVLRALAGLKQRLSFRYVIVGDGPDRDRLDGMAATLGLADRVRLTGAVGLDELPVYYAAADLFIHPNRIEGADFEGFGMVFLEAAAAGVAVIGGNSGGAVEAVARDVTGLLVSGTDEQELRAAIADLAAAPDRRRSMGMAGRARAVREFCWDRARRAVVAIHERVSREYGLD